MTKMDPIEWSEVSAFDPKCCYLLLLSYAVAETKVSNPRLATPGSVCGRLSYREAHRARSSEAYSSSCSLLLAV